MKALFALILGVLFSFSSFAEEEKEIGVKLTARTLKGTTKVWAYHYTNPWGRREVRLEATALPRLGKINPVLGYGRDTDDDGKVDTWFMLDGERGLVVHHVGNAEVWGHRAIEQEIFIGFESSAAAYFTAIYGSLLGHLLISVSHGWSSERQFWREFIDLEEFSLRVHRARSQGALTREQYNDSIDLLYSGYADTLKRFERATGREYLAATAADMALWGTGGILLSWLGRGLAWLGRPLVQRTVVKETMAALGLLIAKISGRIKLKLSRFKSAGEGSIQLLKTEVFKKAFPQRMRAFMMKNQLQSSVKGVLGTTLSSFKSANLQWRYMALLAGLQVGTEAFARSSEVMAPNPYLTAKNVLTNPDILQNVGFMTADTYMFAAATYAIKNKSARFATCGFIALANSAVINLVIKQDDDYKRIALDTGWEAVVSNVQVQVDLAALSHFETMAARSSNPRLKLIGWAVVVVDQAAGYFLYSKATQRLDSVKPNPDQDYSVQLVPVMVEE